MCVYARYGVCVYLGPCVATVGVGDRLRCGATVQVCYVVVPAFAVVVFRLWSRCGLLFCRHSVFVRDRDAYAAPFLQASFIQKIEDGLPPQARLFDRY